MNTCNFCGNKVTGDSKFCTACGAPIAPTPQQMEQQAKPVQQTVQGATQYSTPINGQQVQGGTGKTVGTATASLVLSIIGLIILPFWMGLVGASCGFGALSHLKTFPNDKGKGMAIAGIVIGIIDIAWAIFYGITVASK